MNKGIFQYKLKIKNTYDILNLRGEKQMKNELVIFDCFGVIFDEIAPVFFERYFDLEEASKLKEKLFIPADLGEVTLDELFENVAKEINMDKERIIKEWSELIRLNKDIIPVIEKLKEERTVILLSNAPLGFVENLMKEYELEYLFDKIFISCNLKMAKPDLNIYKHCVNSYDNKFDKVYMIDDNIKNLQHLQEIDIIPIHFKEIADITKTIK